MGSRGFFSFKVVASLFSMLLVAAPSFSAEGGGGKPMCVDVSSSGQPYRVLKLFATPVDCADEQYFSLSGDYMNSSGTVIGLAVGTALLRDEDLIAVASVSAFDEGRMDVSTYQLSAKRSTLNGGFQKISQSAEGILTSSGQMLIYFCN